MVAFVSGLVTYKQASLNHTSLAFNLLVFYSVFILKGD